MKFQWKIILAFAAIYIIWGSTYLAILWVISDIPPLLMSGIRFIAAGTILFGWCLWKREELPGYHSFVKNAICGVWLLKVPPPALVSSYVYVNPAVAILLGALFAGEKITAVQIISLALIIAAVLLVNTSGFKRKRNLQLSAG